MKQLINQKTVQNIGTQQNGKFVKNYNVALIGPQNQGRTTLLNQIADPVHKLKKNQINKFKKLYSDINVQLNFIDLPPMINDRTMEQTCYVLSNSHFIMLTYALENRVYLKQIESIIKFVEWATKYNQSDYQLILLFTKIDQRTIIPEDQILQLYNDCGLDGIIYTSATVGLGLNDFKNLKFFEFQDYKEINVIKHKKQNYFTKLFKSCKRH